MVRIVATALVFAAHISERFATPITIATGGLGVGLFFLLSGFLIALVARRRWPRHGPQFAGFILDRCARIFVPFIPALVLTVLINALVGIQHIDNHGVNTGPLAFVGNLLLLHDYPLLQAASHLSHRVQDFYPRAYNGSEPFWTIPIEFWTYVTFGLFIFTLIRGERRTYLTWALAVIALPIFLWNSFAGGAGNLSLLWVIGAMAAFLWAHSPETSRRSLGIVTLLFGLVSFAGRLAVAGYKSYDMQADIGLALIMFGGFALANGAHRCPPALRTIVKAFASYSYSLYLVHNIIIMAVAARLPAASLSYRITVTVILANLTAIGLYFLAERHYHQVGALLKRKLLPEGMS